MGLLTITSGSMQEHSSVSLSVIGNSTGSSAKPSDISFSTDGGVLWRSGSSLVTSLLAKLGTVTTGTWNATTIGVAYGGTGQTTYTNGQFLIGQTSGNTLAKHAISGDITIDNTGVAAIGNAKVTNNMLAGSIVDSKLSSSYALLSGRSGGQLLSGGTESSEILRLRGTSNATAGTVAFGDGTNYHDDVKRSWYIRPSESSATNNASLDGLNAIVIDSDYYAYIEFVATAGQSETHGFLWRDNVASRGWITYDHSTDTLSFGAGGSGVLSANSTGTIGTFANSSGIKIFDTDNTHTVGIINGSNLTANRTLTIITGDSSRNLTISGDTTLSQDYSTSGTPQFANIGIGTAYSSTASINISKTVSDSSWTGLAATVISTATSGSRDIQGSRYQVNTTTTSNSTQYAIGFYGQAIQTNISSGVTDSGYRIGALCEGQIELAACAGILSKSYGGWFKAGIYNCSSGCTVTNAYGGYFSVLSNDIDGTVTNGYAGYFTNTDTTGAVTNRWGIYVDTGTTGKNYFSSDIGIGTTGPSARLHLIKTTEQLRLGYDSSNYTSITVGSNGETTFDSVGSGSGFIFSDKARFLTAYFSGEIDNGNSGTTKTIDWTAGNNQKVTMTGNCTFTFTAPPGVSHITLKVIQDGTGSRTITWPATVKWAGGTKPTQTTTASAVDIMVFYFDGTNYHGAMASADSK